MIQEPNTWKDPDSHYIKAMSDPWYKLLVNLQNLLSVETMKFYGFGIKIFNLILLL